MDATHPTLGHPTSWVNELARRCERVSVITMFRGVVAVEPNVTVHSLGKEAGYSEPRRLAEFYAATARILRSERVDACFAHMAPLFAALFAPVARARGIPILLWYAHTHVAPSLRVGHGLVDRCATATPAGFAIASDKLRVLGHGVDTDRFVP